MELPASYLWLIAGGVMLALEALAIPGLGFLFAGLAALAVGILVHLQVIPLDNMMMQIGVFGGLTALLALLLWKKLKSWRTDKSASDHFSNIIGDMATVGKGGLKAGQVGQVSWSGTTMSAQLDPKAGVTELAEGSVAEITAVKGNTLFVKPQS